MQHVALIWVLFWLLLGFDSSKDTVGTRLTGHHCQPSGVPTARYVCFQQECYIISWYTGTCMYMYISLSQTCRIR